MDTQTEEAKISEADHYPFVKDIVPGTMSGAGMLAYWKESGVFDVAWPQYDEIGAGRKYAGTTEYINAKRAQAEWQPKG